MARRAELREVESRLIGAKTLPYNPELELELADRSGPGGSSTDRGLSFSQELEIAGQRRKRVAVANQELAAAQSTFLRHERLVAFEVESAFAEAVRDRELLTVAETDASLAREMLDFSSRRLQRGATTQIEVNFARASAGRAERGTLRAQARYASARSRLAQVAGVEPSLRPRPLGELSDPLDSPLQLPPLERLLELAAANRQDLGAAQHQEQASEAAIRLALSEGRPNLAVRAFVQREEAMDDIVGAAVGFSVPLFNRNQGQVAASRAARERRRHEREALRSAIEQEVLEALNDFRAARASAEFLQDQVLGTLEENVELLQRSFAAGRIGATEVVTLRRELVAGRRESIEVQADAWLARIRLALATGTMTLGEESK